MLLVIPRSNILLPTHYPQNMDNSPSSDASVIVADSAYCDLNPRPTSHVGLHNPYTSVLTGPVVLDDQDEPFHLVSAPSNRSSVILKDLDLDDLSLIDLTACGGRRTKQPPKKKLRPTKCSTHSRDSRNSGDQHRSDQSDCRLSSIDSVDSIRDIVPHIRLYRRTQAKIRLQRFRFKRRIIALKVKHGLGNLAQRKVCCLITGRHIVWRRLNSLVGLDSVLVRLLPGLLWPILSIS